MFGSILNQATENQLACQLTPQESVLREKQRLLHQQVNSGYRHNVLWMARRSMLIFEFVSKCSSFTSTGNVACMSEQELATSQRIFASPSPGFILASSELYADTMNLVLFYHIR